MSLHVPGGKLRSFLDAIGASNPSSHGGRSFASSRRERRGIGNLLTPLSRRRTPRRSFRGRPNRRFPSRRGVPNRRRRHSHKSHHRHR